MVEVFLERAKQLSGARDLVQDDADYASAIALLSVHSAIALNDALLIKLSGKTVTGDDHMQAVREMAKGCRSRKLDATGIAQITTLMSAKTRVSYGDEATSYALAFKLSIASQRFEAWVYKRLEEIV
jgi:hypothetical protein